MPGLDKLLQSFAALASWKARRRNLLVALLRVWHCDANAILRQKLRIGIVDRIAPLLATIVAQGTRESVFEVSYPDQSSRVIVSLVQDLNESLATLFLADDLDWRTVADTLAAYTDALERILGTPTGSVVLVDLETLRPWFNPENGAS